MEEQNNGVVGDGGDSQQPEQAPVVNNEAKQPVGGGNENNSGGNESKPGSGLKIESKQVNVTQEEKVWSFLAYLPMVSLATLILKSKSPYCRLHGTQGLVIFGLEFLMIFVSAISPLIGGVLLFVVLVVAAIAAIKAFMGFEFKIPIIVDIAKMIPVEAMIGNVTGVDASKTSDAQQAEADMRSGQQQDSAADTVSEQGQANDVAQAAVPPVNVEGADQLQGGGVSGGQDVSQDAVQDGESTTPVVNAGVDKPAVSSGEPVSEKANDAASVVPGSSEAPKVNAEVSPGAAGAEEVQSTAGDSDVGSDSGGSVSGEDNQNSGA